MSTITQTTDFCEDSERSNPIHSESLKLLQKYIPEKNDRKQTGRLRNR